MGWGRSARERGRKARDEAERDYEAQRKMRPVVDAPPTLLSALRAFATPQTGVRSITLAEQRDERGRLSRLLVGVRLGPGSAARFKAIEGAIQAAVRDALATAAPVEVVELDEDVDETTADGSPNPYLIVGGR